MDALILKPGPTESGLPAEPTPPPVGGEILSIDKLSVFISHYGLLIILLLLTLSFLLYKRRGRVFQLLTRFVARFGLLI